MPLKCLRGDEAIYAFDVESDEAWKGLRKRNAEAKDLRMRCCGASVVLRTSKLGTRHFAHARRDPCSTAPETAEHLLAKMAVVDGIRGTGWKALPEQEGRTPDGEGWKADVLAEKGKARVAFEIQWSRQDEAETERRQRRYADAGVRGLWLFRQHDFPTGKETPAFRRCSNRPRPTSTAGGSTSPDGLNPPLRSAGFCSNPPVFKPRNTPSGCLLQYGSWRPYYYLRT